MRRSSTQYRPARGGRGQHGRRSGTRRILRRAYCYYDYRLEWRNGSVVLTLDPYVSLAGRELELIDLDGSVALELGADTAVIDDKGGTLTWTVTGQPWEDGDLLMLRIAEVDTETHQ